MDKGNWSCINTQKIFQQEMAKEIKIDTLLGKEAEQLGGKKLGMLMVREGFITTLCKYSQSLRILEKSLHEL